MSMRYGVHLCFSGANYAGWQRQANAVSIQEKIESALSVLLKAETEITGCGRTDTGVNAANFYAHFDTEIELGDLKEFSYHLNAILPNDIRVFEIFEAPTDWHARFSATRRTYRYFISSNRNPFFDSFQWYVPFILDENKMNQAAQMLVGSRDFTSFAKLHGGQKTNICEVYQCSVMAQNEMLVLEISADRFLRNMVRAVTGTLVDIGRGKTAPDEITQILESKNRSAAGASVPARGLFLSAVHYEHEKVNCIPENRPFTLGSL